MEFLRSSLKFGSHIEKKLGRKYYPLILATPFIIFIFAFYYVPLFGWIYALFDYKPGIPLIQSNYVGLEHFREIFGPVSDMGSVFCNTIAMNFLNILVSPLPMAFAIMISQVKSRGFRKIVQTATTLPNFISWIIVYSLSFSIFSSEGLLNQLFELLGTDIMLNLLGNKDITWYFQTAIGLWKSLGWTAIIYLAAITGIDGELYDAANVDGAGRIRTIWHITIPGIIPTFLVLLLLGIGNMLSNNFEQYMVFYNSIVAEKIEVVDYYAYRVGIIMNDYPLGTAISISKSFVSIILLFSVNYLSRKLRGNSLFLKHREFTNLLRNSYAGVCKGEFPLPG